MPVLQVRISDDDLAYIKARAADASCSVANYVRAMLGTRLRGAPVTAAVGTNNLGPGAPPQPRTRRRAPTVPLPARLGAMDGSGSRSHQPTPFVHPRLGVAALRESGPLPPEPAKPDDPGWGQMVVPVDAKPPSPGKQPYHGETIAERAHRVHAILERAAHSKPREPRK